MKIQSSLLKTTSLRRLNDTVNKMNKKILKLLMILNCLIFTF